MFLRIFTNPNDDGDEDISSSGSKPVGERKKSTRNIFLVLHLASSPSGSVAAPSFFAFSKTSNALRLGLDAAHLLDIFLGDLNRQFGRPNPVN